MGKALVRLAKVYVPPHESVTEGGQAYSVGGYWRTEAAIRRHMESRHNLKRKDIDKKHMELGHMLQHRNAENLDRPGDTIGHSHRSPDHGHAWVTGPATKKLHEGYHAEGHPHGTVKLARVFIPPHESVTKEGRAYHVSGYWENRPLTLRKHSRHVFAVHIGDQHVGYVARQSNVSGRGAGWEFRSARGVENVHSPMFTTPAEAAEGLRQHLSSGISYELRPRPPRYRSIRHLLRQTRVT